MLLSIIIPVYNVECYVETCINSILKCELNDCEVILVLGHSTDKSNEICYRFSSNYNNIKILVQQDTGLSDARNCGLEIAKGQYVTFIDSDDFVDTECFDIMLNMLRRAIEQEIEVFVSDYNMVTQDGKLISNIRQIKSTDESIDNYDYLKTFLNQKGCFWNVWRYIYNKEFLMKNNLSFKLYSLSEDIEYTVKVLMKAKQFMFLHNPYYQYRVGREQSLMNTSNFKRVFDTVTIIEESMQMIQESPEFPFYKPVLDHLSFEWILNLALIFEVPVEERKRAKEIFLSSKDVLKKSDGIFQRIICWSISLVGIMPVAFLLYVLKKMKRGLKRIKIKLRKESKQINGVSKDFLEV